MKMSKMNSSLDPITLEIMFNALRSIADETFITLMKSAYSTNIKERRDHSTAIMDKSGRLIVQADASLPVHLASMGGLMISLLEKYKDDISQGDIFIGNDPHVAGGTHLMAPLKAFWSDSLGRAFDLYSLNISNIYIIFLILFFH